MATVSTSTGVLAGSISVGPLTLTGTGTNWVSNTTITANSIQTNVNLADQVWQGWVNMGTTTGLVVYHPEEYYNQPVWNAWVEDDEQRIARLERERVQRDELQARREQQNRERHARELEQMENQIMAHARALELLDDILTEEERALRIAEQRVAIRGSDGNLYWLEMNDRSVHGNIVRTDEHGCRLGRACVAPRMYDLGGEALPLPDGWVGQYLGLKFDAETFLSHANWSGRTTCQQPDQVDVDEVAA
jgi:hypothetical protein